MAETTQAAGAKPIEGRNSLPYRLSEERRMLRGLWGAYFGPLPKPLDDVIALSTDPERLSQAHFELVLRLDYLSPETLMRRLIRYLSMRDKPHEFIDPTP